MLPTLSDDDLDALRELCNLAIGAGGEALADFSGEFVTLSIPRIVVTSAADLVADALSGLGSVNAQSAAGQSFTLAGATGYALCVSCSDSLAVLAQNPRLNSAAIGSRLQKQLSQTVICSALKRLSEVMELALCLGAVELLCHDQPPNSIVLPSAFQEPKCIAVEMNYRLESTVFNASLVLLIPAPVLQQLLSAIERLMAD